MHFVWFEWHLEISEAFEFYLILNLILAIEVYFKNTWQILEQKYERSKHDTPKKNVRRKYCQKVWIQIWIYLEFAENVFILFLFCLWKNVHVVGFIFLILLIYMSYIKIYYRFLYILFSSLSYSKKTQAPARPTSPASAERHSPAG